VEARDHFRGAAYDPKEQRVRKTTEAVRPGVVRLSCGAWYDPAGDEDEPACARGNANVLTRDHGTSRLSQGPSSATALVEVAKCADPSPLGAFAPVPLTAQNASCPVNVLALRSAEPHAQSVGLNGKEPVRRYWASFIEARRLFNRSDDLRDSSGPISSGAFGSDASALLNMPPVWIDAPQP
jgi:hypothetical protein